MPTLEQAVGDLTATSQQLIDTFNAKNAVIDVAVAAAIAAVPNLNYTFFVDAVVGDDTNNGASATPFLTLVKALQSCTVGAVCNIYLTAGQSFVVDDNIITDAKSINILTTDNTVLTNILIESYVLNISGGDFNRSRYISAGSSLTFSFNGFIKIAFSGKTNAALAWSSISSFFSHFSKGLISVNVLGSSANSLIVEVNDSHNILRSHAVGSNFFFNAYYADLTLKAGSVPTPIFYNSFGVVISSLSTTTLTDATFSTDNSRVIGDIL